MDNLFSGLLGAVIGGFMGGFVALVAVGRQIGSDRDLRRTDKLTALLAEFWGACDALWEAKKDLGYTVLAMQADRQAGPSAAIQDSLETRRQAAFAVAETADREARKALAQFRLLFGQLTDPAEDLFESSRATYRIAFETGELTSDVGDTREKALAAFERAAKAALKS